MFNSQMYGKWQSKLKQQIPDRCESRLRNLTLLMVGIFISRSVYLSVIARKIPVRAKKLSLSKRFERFLDNSAVDVEEWYRSYIVWLLTSAGSGGTINLVIDSTKVSTYGQQMMVAVAYQRRSLPIMWE